MNPFQQSVTFIRAQEDDDEWRQEKHVAAPDAEVDPWGNNQHLGER